MDMTEGIIARFRTMAISRASVLTGHVIGSVIQTMLGLAIVIGVALLIGFRPTAGPVEWIAAIGVLALLSIALTWLSVALGLVSKSVETASNLPMLLVLLPFLEQRVRPHRLDARQGRAGSPNISPSRRSSRRSEGY